MNVLKRRAKLLREVEKHDPITAKLMRKSKDYAALSADDVGKVSYTTTHEHRFNDRRRTKTTLGRYLRRQLGSTLADTEMQELVRNVFGVMAAQDGSKFKFLTGRDIMNAYEDEIGGSSCMTGDEASYVEMYALNTGKVKLLVYEGMARALLWTTDDGEKLLDRIYPNDGEHVNAIQEWATREGYWLRENQSLPSGSRVRFSKGLGCRSDFNVTLEHDGTWPYMDSFHWGVENGSLIAFQTNSDGAEHKYDDTCGDRSSNSRCYNCGCENDECSHEHNGETYCETCFCELYSWCDECDSYEDANGFREVDGSYWCESCVDNNATQCDGCGNYSAHTTEADDTGNTFCDSCGDDKLASCEECGSYVEDYRFTENSEVLCHECSEECEDCGDAYKKSDLEEGRCEDCAEAFNEAEREREAEREAEMEEKRKQAEDVYSEVLADAIRRAA